jgi:ABC-type uncharacterized transport system auxiliary subunit
VEPDSDNAGKRSEGTAMRFALPSLTLVAVFAVGCGSVRYARTYTLDLTGAAVAAPARPAALAAVAVRDFTCPDYLSDGRIVYRPTRTEVGYYEYHRWATTLRRVITDSIAGRLRTQGVFGSVESAQNAGGVTYVLTGAIERLEEVDDGRDVQAVVQLSAQLVDTRTQKTVWRHSEIASEPVIKRDVSGVVGGLSAATRRAIDALIASLESDVALDVQNSVSGFGSVRR